MFNKNSSKASTFAAKRGEILRSFKKALDGLINLNSEIEKRQDIITKETEALEIESQELDITKQSNIHSINTITSILEPNKSQ